MTGLTIEYGVPPARRHAARAAPLADTGRTAAVVRPPSASPSARPDAPKAKPGAWRVTGAIALAVTALHGVALLAARTCRAARAAAEAAADDGRTDAAARTVAAGRASAAAGSAAEAVEAGADPPKPRAAVAHPAPAPLPRRKSPARPATAAPAAAAPATPAPAPAAPAAPARETAPIGDAAYLRNPAPDYPAFAQDQGWEGRVVLRVHVLANGSPDSVEVRTSSGRPCSTRRRWPP